jgi:hypothetical protein
MLGLWDVLANIQKLAAAFTTESAWSHIYMIAESRLSPWVGWVFPLSRCVWFRAAGSHSSLPRACFVPLSSCCLFPADGPHPLSPEFWFSAVGHLRPPSCFFTSPPSSRIYIYIYTYILSLSLSLSLSSILSLSWCLICYFLYGFASGWDLPLATAQSIRRVCEWFR